MKKKEKYEVIWYKYRVKKKGLNLVLEELKQRLQAKATKILRYGQSKKRVYQQLNGKVNNSKNPDAEESGDFGIVERVAIKMLNGWKN